MLDYKMIANYFASHVVDIVSGEIAGIQLSPGA